MCIWMLLNGWMVHTNSINEYELIDSGRDELVLMGISGIISDIICNICDLFEYSLLHQLANFKQIN